MSLQGKVAVITGGTRGLGRSIAEAYLAAGAHVLYAGRGGAWPAESLTAESLTAESVTAERSAFAPVDVTDAASVTGLFEIARERFGRVDVVVANAGISRPGAIADLAEPSWDEVIATNLTGVFRTVRAAVPHLRKEGGRIITVSSVLAGRAVPAAGAYAASKAGVEALTRTAAVELAPLGITVNCLAPGFIAAGMGLALTSNEQVWSHFSTKLAGGRVGTAAEVARAAVFLAGPDSDYINGHILEINGGLRW
ncbi:SDR family NAD(P)-dependent oxidoreductase [Protofrankia symbiont of Coriaria ruscifolia]|uniref:SDR family NAD(P)-dependent oxidoreductase n=1 Tax=Protofrankia symbiont of Coriaria ruscifolia TaxID=1306542 RepID=UPI00104172C0|nr:SDR family NAD(P)-dependent oxidoreductase [Protofrankia symbiont of Coriaria ruscifolia]